MPRLSRTSVILLLTAGAFLFYSRKNESPCSSCEVTAKSMAGDAAMNPAAPNGTAPAAEEHVLPVRGQDNMAAANQ